MPISVGRLSSLQFNLTSRNYVSNTTLALQRAGKEVSTGIKSNIYDDLGPRAAMDLKLRTQEEQTKAFLSSNDLLGNKLSAMLTSVDAIRDQVSGVIENAIINSSRPSNGASALQAEARAAMESIVATLNTSYNGEFIFSGTSSDTPPMTRWAETNAATGWSPESVMQGIVGAGPTDETDALDMIDQIDRIFNSSIIVSPERNFEETFYSGTPELDALGQPNARLRGRVSAGQDMQYGIQANDQGFRDIVKGLAMLATTDVSKITDLDAYSTWMNHVVESLSVGQEGALSASANIGFNQQVVEDAKSRLADLSVVHQTQIADFETVDPYEAITRLTNLETQLQASYQVSARLSSLSIINFL